MIMMNGILVACNDLDLRIHHRSQMEAAGLYRLLELLRGFGHTPLDKLLRIFQQTLDEDERKLRERLDQEFLKDLRSPEDVFRAIQAKTENLKAKDYLLSTLQHLLLIREDGPALTQYYQLIDSIVADVVLDKKLAGAEHRFGQPVEQIIARFNEADRLQAVEDEAAEARAYALQLKLEKDALDAEISQGVDGLVGKLKEQIARLEEKLQVSRTSNARLQGRLETQKAGYEEQITQLEAQIMELFKMLKEVGKGVEKVFENSGGMDRRTLIGDLEKHLHRHKTISILEGRDKRKAQKHEGDADRLDESDTEDDSGSGIRSGSLRRRPANSSMKKRTKSARLSETQNGHLSQFMDADDAEAQEQLEQQFAAGVNTVCATFCSRLVLFSYYLPSPRSHRPLEPEVSGEHQGDWVVPALLWMYLHLWLLQMSLRATTTMTMKPNLVRVVLQV
jgi:cytokinesis protein